MIYWLYQGMAKAEFVCSASTGAHILAKAGLIHNRRVTTHYAMIDGLHRLCPRANVVFNQQVVVDGKNLITCAGGTAAINLALAIVQRYGGDQAMAKAAHRVEYSVAARQPADA